MASSKSKSSSSSSSSSSSRRLVKRRLSPVRRATTGLGQSVKRNVMLIRSALLIHLLATMWLPDCYLEHLSSIWARLVIAILVIGLLCVDVVSAVILVAAYIYSQVELQNRKSNRAASVTPTIPDTNNSIVRPNTGGDIPNAPVGVPDKIADNLYPRADPGRDRGMPGMEQVTSAPVNEYESQIGTLPVTREQGMYGHQMAYAKVNQGQQDTTLNNVVEGFGSQCGAQLSRSHEAFQSPSGADNNGMAAAQGGVVLNSGGEYDDGAVKSYLEAQRAQDAGFTTAEHLRAAQTNVVAGPGPNNVAMDHQVVASQSNMWNTQGAPSICQAPGTNNQLCYSGIDDSAFGLAQNAGL